MSKCLQRIIVCVGLVLAAMPAEGADLGFNGVDLRAGLAIPSDWDNGTTFGVSFDLGELTNGLYLYPGVRYSMAEQSESIFGTELKLEAEDLALGAEVRYFPAKDQRGWYFGGGVYMHMIDYDVTILGAKASLSSDQVGPAGVAGYLWKRGGLSFFTEARYDVADVFDRAEVLIGIGFGGE